MKKNFIVSCLLLLASLFGIVFGCHPTNTLQANAAQYNEHFSEVFSDPNMIVELDYSTSGDLLGTLDITFELEKDEEIQRNFKLYFR